MSRRTVPCSRSWSISEDSLKRYVQFASESCIQELLAASDTNRGNSNNDEWKVLTLDNGVEISKRRSGSFHTFRSRWVLRSVSPQQFITVANAIDAAKQWDSDLVEAKYIKEIEDNLSIIRLRFGDNSKPLFRNREFIVYERRQTMEDGTVVVAVASLPKEIAAGLHPKQNNSIRGLLLQSGWVVEKLEDNSCAVTYVVQMAAVERLSMYARDREYAAAVMDIKVVGNAGPDIDNKVRKDLINMRTFHLEYDVCSRKGRLPAAFARGFGVQVAPFVMLRDPNFNEFEVAIAKKNGKVYFTDGWGVLKSFYGIVGGGWVTVVYSNRHLFLMELRNLHGEEVAYPVTNPPAKLMLQNQNAIDYRMSFVPYGPAGRFLPTTFHHTVEKVLTDSDATTGVLKLGWLGFCRDALPADKTDLTLIDYLGYTWKLMMDFAHDDQLSCVFSGEWQAVCNARKLVEGVKIKIGVTEEAGNKVLYLCGPQMMVLRTSVPPSKSIGRQGPSYRLDHYFWKN